MTSLKPSPAKTSTPAAGVAKIETFGDLAPWAEPAWYNTLASPYYNDSHKRLREAIRSYVDEHILPYEEEWEENGEVPREVSVTLSFYDRHSSRWSDNI